MVADGSIADVWVRVQGSKSPPLHQKVRASWHETGLVPEGSHLRRGGSVDRSLGSEAQVGSKATFTFCRVNGAERRRTPVASKTAFEIDAGTMALEGSPAPNGGSVRSVDQLDHNLWHFGKGQNGGVGREDARTTRASENSYAAGSTTSLTPRRTESRGRRPMASSSRAGPHQNLGSGRSSDRPGHNRLAPSEIGLPRWLELRSDHGWLR